jgi:GNAT superfamily N-acetyltransferase
VAEEAIMGKGAEAGHLVELFARDRVRNSYHIGALTPAYVDQTRLCRMEAGGKPVAALMAFLGLSAPAVFTWGDPAGIQQLVTRYLGHLPDRILLHRYPEHASAFDGLLKVSGNRRVVRMALTRDGFKPAGADVRCESLGHADTPGIVKLYEDYPDRFFDPYQLESGHYFGLKHDRELISVAGIHLLAPELRFAMLGNIVTAPAAQGKGYAKALTSRLCTELFKFADLLVLDVPMASSTAMRVFAGLGFEPVFSYDQTLARLLRGPGRG